MEPLSLRCTLCKGTMTHRSLVSCADLRQKMPGTSSQSFLLGTRPTANAHFLFLARTFGEVWGMNFRRGQTSLRGKFRHLDLKVEGSRPDSTWLKRDTRIRTSPSLWFPPMGPQKFPHLSPAEALIPRAPRQSCLKSRDPCPTMGRSCVPFLWVVRP